MKYSSFSDLLISEQFCNKFLLNVKHSVKHSNFSGILKKTVIATFCQVVNEMQYADHQKMQHEDLILTNSAVVPNIKLAKHSFPDKMFFPSCYPAVDF